jgi:hypothetical protein
LGRAIREILAYIRVAEELWFIGIPDVGIEKAHKLKEGHKTPILDCPV